MVRVCFPPCKWFKTLRSFNEFAVRCQVTLTTAVFGAANGVPVLAKLGWMYLNEPRKNLSI